LMGEQIEPENMQALQSRTTCEHYRASTRGQIEPENL
jgi:hypothetical protein